MNKFYQLTHPSSKNFANQIAANINKDHPNSAFTKDQAGGFVVLINMEYYNYCKEYVKVHCRIKPEELRKSA
jgi:hypothetical protein